MNNTYTTQVNQQWFLQHTTPTNTNKRAYYNWHWYDKQVWGRGESTRSVEFRRWEAIKLYATTTTVIFISLTYMFIFLVQGKQGEKLAENGAFLIKFSPVFNFTIVVWSLL